MEGEVLVKGQRKAEPRDLVVDQGYLNSCREKRRNWLNGKTTYRLNIYSITNTREEIGDRKEQVGDTVSFGRGDASPCELARR